MYLKVDLEGTVIHLDESTRFALDEEASLLETSDKVKVNINDVTGKLVNIEVPVSPANETYYAKLKEGHFVFSQDFFSLAEMLEKRIEDRESINSFIEHWTFPTGKTYFKEIFRLIPGMDYDIQKGVIVYSQKQITTKNLSSSAKKLDTQYELFKSAIDSTIKESASKKINGLLLSGGVDSVLLGLVMDKLSIPFKAYTSNTTLSFQSAMEDQWDSELIAQKLGWQHEVVLTNLDDISISSLNDIQTLMPVSSHTSFHFLALAKQMKKQGVHVAFSGQNMDNLYNLGPTSRMSLRRSNLADFIRRIFLTSPYFKTLVANPKTGFISSMAWRAIALLFSRLYSFFKKSSFIPPKTVEELVNNYCQSNDYSVFGNDYEKSKIKKCNISSASDVRSCLLDYKVNNYLMTGPPQSIYQSGNLYGVKVCLPYSSEEMVKMFYTLDMGYKDMIYPKRYVYDYIKELAGMSYKELLKGRKISNAPDYQAWVKDMLNNTEFGKSITRAVDTTDNPKGFTPAHNLQRYLAKYWVLKTQEKLRRN